MDGTPLGSRHRPFRRIRRGIASRFALFRVDFEMAMAAGTSSTFLGRTLPTRPGTSNGGRVAMMAGKKGVRVVVTVECTEQAESGVPGISRYTTQKVRLLARWDENEPQEDGAVG